MADSHDQERIFVFLMNPAIRKFAGSIRTPRRYFSMANVR